MLKRLTNLILILTLVLGLPGQIRADAPIKLESTNYGIESLFFGNTGVIYSYTASIPPVITQGPTISAITQTTAQVKWTTDKASSSRLYVGLSPGVYQSERGAADPTLVQSHTVNLTGLTRGTKYYLKVRSVDIDGNTIDSSELNFQSDPGDITAPVITSGPFISIDSASLVTVTWETDELASTTVEYGAGQVDENQVGPGDDLTLFHQVRISGLTPSQSYTWRVRSKDASGNVTYSAEQQLSTPNSPFISGFQITDVTLTSAVVQWNTSTASTTIVEYGVASSVYPTKLNEASFSTNHIVRLSDLESGTVYYLRVSGVDQSGNLLQSDEKVFATVVIPQISNLRANQLSADSAVITWLSSSAVDELLRYEILDHPDKSFIGKKFSGGSDELKTDHTYDLIDLESSATYALSVLGKDIFGNQASSDTIVFTTLADSTPPEFLIIRSDTTIDLGSRQTVQVLVSCELSELGKVVIEYGPGASGPYDKKVETDQTFSRAKFLVIPGLEPGQSYHYRVIANDRVGNITTSADYLVLAPKQPLSLLDLIFGQIQLNFGWLQDL